MADGEDEDLTPDEEVHRSASRTLVNILILGIVVLGGLTWTLVDGFYTLQPGQSAVLLRFGRHLATVNAQGPHISLPRPFVQRTIVNVSEVQNEDFGLRSPETADSPRASLLEATMQTSDNNIVRVGFAVQFRIKDPFKSLFRVANPEAVVRDAAQAAMREVVGRESVDGVLRDNRAMVTAETALLLQEILDSYDAGIDIDKVQLQDVQPPEPVRAAFEDVVSANQDANRVVDEAEGYRNEVIPGARAEAVEARESAFGYRDSRVAEATGEAARFLALVVEYRKAPRVTRKRLYLETMEQVLPDVEKVIIEPGTAQILPYLPLGASKTGTGP